MYTVYVVLYVGQRIATLPTRLQNIDTVYVKSVIPPMDRKFNETRTILFARLRSSLNMHNTERLSQYSPTHTFPFPLPIWPRTWVQLVQFMSFQSVLAEAINFEL